MLGRLNTSPGYTVGVLFKRCSPNIFYAGGLSIASLCVHVIPFVLYGSNPLGYDTGFYRRYLIESFVSFPNTAVPGLGNDAWGPRILLDSLRLLHVPTDIALYGSYLMLYALLPVLVFFYLRNEWGAKTAFVAGLFVVLSSVAYQAYWYMLFKNIFALDLLIVAFIAIEKKRKPTTYLLDVFIALSHATSAIVYMLTLAARFVFTRESRSEMLSHFFLTAIAFVLVNVTLIRGVSVSLPTALFIEWSQFLWLSLPYLLLLAALWRLPIHKPVPTTLIAFTTVSFVYPILHLPFYQRIFVYADLGLALLAAYAAYALGKHFAKTDLHGFEYIRATIVCISIGLLLGDLYYQIHSLQPIISQDSIFRIETVGKILPPDALVLTSANEAPWYEGWTSAHIAAPGLLHDTHTLDQWQALWDATSTQYRIKFLDSFNAPLYVSTLAPYADLVGEPPACLIKVTPDLLHDTCSH
jgi:hypothetical protein